MRALTVRQPWAGAIAHAGKGVENRGWGTSYRGPLAIHAASQFAGGDAFARIASITGDFPLAPYGELAAFVCVADLVDVHFARMLDEENGCCDPWGEQPAPGGRPIKHWVLRDVVVLERPIPNAGHLSLWLPPAEVLDELHDAWAGGRP